ncbi:LOW QUALITY PROTEIN: acyl-protein thioesterase 1-like [Rhagoletis pomonella]|uniref:LOW QUALITY PROTEIN: acyl-protein thioesterase 1-like n=1 Tax=Rhagoletis pomonella TaxID=28610 RepID=UPI00177FC563|nr:LOW QUALITY PROTEIN: acyl-protein thioesterase 1-like [Rhagoletis pomonella]
MIRTGRKGTTTSTSTSKVTWLLFWLTNSSMSIAPVIIEATAKHTSTLIFMHGLGDTGHGWSSALAMIRPPSMKVICPTAPTMPVSLNAGFRMPSWFDLRTLEFVRKTVIRPEKLSPVAK